MLLNMPKKGDSIVLILNSHVNIQIQHGLNKSYASVNGITDYGDHEILLPKGLKLNLEEMDNGRSIEFNVLEDCHNLKKDQKINLLIKDINQKLNFEYIKN